MTVAEEISKYIDKHFECLKNNKPEVTQCEFRFKFERDVGKYYCKLFSTECTRLKELNL